MMCIYHYILFYRSGVCVEKWLMFRANVDPALITVTDSLICINNEGLYV